MRITHISDTHGNKINPGKACDLLIHSGDICRTRVHNLIPCVKSRTTGKIEPCGWQDPWNFRKIDKEAEALAQTKDLLEQRDYLVNKKGLAIEDIVAVCGNHDFLTLEPIFPNSLTTGSRIIVVKGKKIGLLAGVLPIMGEWNDEIEEYDILQRILALDRDIDILVSHVAPYGILDSAYGGMHTGSQELYQAIFGKSVFDEQKPYFENLTLHCFGHSHEGKGKKKYEIDGRTIIFSNAACGRMNIEI